MRAALEKSDCQAAISSANKILASEPADNEAQKVLKQCNLAAGRLPAR
jgi:hypothetical protein